MHPILVWTVAFLTTGLTFAQSSTSYTLEEHTFNAGGRPHAGSVAASASYEISLDAIGAAVARTGLSSDSFSMDAGFVEAYAAPGEVLGLRFDDAVTLLWDAEHSAGVYNLYRQSLGMLTGGAATACHEAGIAGPSATDLQTPAAGNGFAYLVTVENRLQEEGTMGYDSAAVERANSAPCP